MKIISYILSGHSGIKLEFKIKRSYGGAEEKHKLIDSVTLCWMIKWETEEIKMQILKFLEVYKHESTAYRNPWETVQSTKGSFHSASSVPKPWG